MDLKKLYREYRAGEAYAPRHRGFRMLRRGDGYQPRHLGKDESKVRSMTAAAAVVLGITLIGLVSIQPAAAPKPAPQVMMVQPVSVHQARVAAQTADRQILEIEKTVEAQRARVKTQNKHLATAVENTAAWENRLRRARAEAAKRKIAPYVRPNLSAIKQYALERVGEYQFRYLDLLWTRESGWRWNADNPTSSAYGIPQALPGSKMASAGADWRTNPYTQIRWGLGYIAEVYGSPQNAWAHSEQTGWY